MPKTPTTKSSQTAWAVYAKYFSDKKWFFQKVFELKKDAQDFAKKTFVGFETKIVKISLPKEI